MYALPDISPIKSKDFWQRPDALLYQVECAHKQA
jgi:hypothetical protein